ncbi:MAG TPA: MurR/RpiR family transcriptional regulator [Phenylobacterium sp.]
MPPQTPDDLRAAILERYDGLSRVLQQIARYVLEDPNTVALETLSVIAERCGAPPSGIVRFAKTMGFDGASSMQRMLRDGLLADNVAISYGERIRAFNAAIGQQEVGPSDMLLEFVEGNTLALRRLVETIPPAELARAVDEMRAANTIFVAGFRRAFPIASYLAYSLQQANKRTIFVDGVGGLARPQVQTMGEGDLLVAISFAPYAAETLEIADIASEHRAHILAISDSPVSPLAKRASLTLAVHDAEVRGFRSLAASMCLAQTLVIAYAFETEGTGSSPRRV